MAASREEAEERLQEWALRRLMASAPSELGIIFTGKIKPFHPGDLFETGAVAVVVAVYAHQTWHNSREAHWMIMNTVQGWVESLITDDLEAGITQVHIRLWCRKWWPWPIDDLVF